MTESTLPTDLQTYFQVLRGRVDRALDHFLPGRDHYPETLHEAMRYSVFAGGKRVRPILALATAEALEGPEEAVLRLACCLEMIHTYSLVHDDLPAMDDDDFRRGLPTLHKKYGEGIAILTGNALLTLALQLLSRLPEDGAEPALVLRLIDLLCRSIGSDEGMIAGQVVDLLAAGKEFSEQELRYIHRAKTAALIRGSITSAALLSGADTIELEHLSRFGSSIGLVFQIVDDILDVEASSADLGKTAGKDQLAEKATFPALHGMQESRRIRDQFLALALQEVEVLGARGERLRQIANFVASRRH